MRCWITGVGGFLGSHLAEELQKQGHEVDGNDSGICNSLPIAYDRRVDCRDFKCMEDLFLGFKPDVVIHCAATAHEGLSNFSPSFITKNIYEASVATFSAAIACGVKRIVFMSSMARYGSGCYNELARKFNIKDSDSYDGFKKFDPPFYEWHPPSPIDPYGIAKVAAEDTLKALCKLHNVEHVIVVPHNIIGPRQKYNDPYRNVASIMINRALQDKSIIVYGDGQQKRCFSPIKDCLHSLTKIIDAPISGDVINIGPDGGEITVLELAEKIKKLANQFTTIQHVASRPNEVKEAYCSSDKARRLLGYNPQQSIDECLQEMVDYIKEHGVLDFRYDFPIEIQEGCPATWLQKII